MNETTYRKVVAKLANKNLSADERLVNWALGLAGESAEVDTASAQGDYARIKDELSDCRWYLTAFEIDLDLPVAFMEINEADSRMLAPLRMDNRLSLFTRLLMRRAGLVADTVKKIVCHGHGLELDREKLVRSLADYSSAYLMTLLKTELDDEEVTTYNYAKLAARYKDLTFTTKQSINRVNG